MDGRSGGAANQLRPDAGRRLGQPLGVLRGERCAAEDGGRDPAHERRRAAGGDARPRLAVQPSARRLRRAHRSGYDDRGSRRRVLPGVLARRSPQPDGIHSRRWAGDGSAGPLRRLPDRRRRWRVIRRGARGRDFASWSGVQEDHAALRKGAACAEAGAVPVEHGQPSAGLQRDHGRLLRRDRRLARIVCRERPAGDQPAARHLVPQL